MVSVLENFKNKKSYVRILFFWKTLFILMHFSSKESVKNPIQNRYFINAFHVWKLVV